MPVQNLSGKAMSLTFKGAGVDITSASPTHKRTVKDNTSSKNYDSASDMLWKSQIPVDTSVEFDIAGQYDLNQTSTLFLAELHSGNAPVAITFNLNTGTVYGHGNFDLTELKVTGQVDDIVKFTAKAQSNGTWTTGS